MKTILLSHRWLVVVGAVLIQLALGAIYAWSVLTKQLTDSAGNYGFSATQTAWIWMAPFIVAGTACLLGAIVMALINPPVHPGEPA